MLRTLYLTLCLLLLLACGGDAGPDGDASAPDTPIGEPPAGDFDLEVRGTPRPGQRLPVRLIGDRAGVEIAIFVAIDPIEALNRLPEPGGAGQGGEFRWEDPRFEETWRRQATDGHRFVFPRAVPGVFVVAARLGERSVARTLVICDLITVVKRSSAGTLLFAADAETGLPAAGVPVLLATEFGSREGRTDGSGVFRSLDPAGGIGVLTALTGSREHLSRPVRMPPVSGSGTDESSPIRTWLATDRPACFPGQTIHFRGILRQREGRRYRVRDTEADFWACDASDRIIFPATGLPALEDGEFAGSVQVPPEAPPGPYRIYAGSKLGVASRAFQVAVPVGPHARVRISFLPEKPGIGEEVSVVIRATDRYGSLPAGAQVHYRVTGPSKIRPDTREVLARGERVLGTGEEAVTVFTPDNHGRYQVEAELRDPGGTLGSATSELTVSKAGPEIELSPARLFCTTGEAVAVRVRVTDATGQGGALTGEFRIGDTGMPVELQSGETREFIVSFDTPGRHEVSTTFDVTRAVQSRASCTIVAIGANGEGPPVDRLEVVPEKREYRAGESARMLVVLPTDLTGVSCLETLEGERLGTHSVRRPDSRVFVREIVVPDALGEACAFGVAAVRNRRIRRARGEFRVLVDQALLRVSIEMEPEKPRPGELVRMRVKVADGEGNPVAATASLSVFDEKLVSLVPEGGPSIEEFFYGRRSGGVSTATSLSGTAAGPVGERPGPRESDGGAGPVPAVPRDAGRSVHWEPRLAIGRDGLSREQSITLPGYAARWRVVARVATPDTRVGTSKLVFDAANAVTVEPHLPGFLNEGDIVRVPVRIRCAPDHPNSGTLKFGAEGFRLMDDEYREIALTDGSGEAVEVATLVADKVGEALLSAEFGGSRVERRTVVGPTGQVSRFFAAGTLKGPRTYVPFTLPASTNMEDARLVVRLHADPLEALVDSIGRSFEGASLGVRVQRAAVELAIARFLTRGNPEPAAEGEESDHAILLLEVAGRQRPGGGWGFSDEETPDPLESILVLDGLSLLLSDGIPVAKATMDHGFAFLESYLSSGSGSADPVLTAYAIRILLRSGTPLSEAAEALLDPRSVDQLPPAAVAHLVLALLEGDRRKDAAMLAARLDAAVHEGGDGQAWWGMEGARGFPDSPTPTTSAALQAHLALGSESSLEYAARAGRHLLHSRQGSSWRSGLDTVFARRALLSLLEASPRPTTGESAVRVRLGNAILGGHKLSTAGGDGPRTATFVAKPMHLNAGRNRVSIESVGDIELLFTVEVSWREPRTPSLNADLRLARSIRGRGGSPQHRKITASPGDILVVALAVDSDRPRRRLVLDCPLPAGVLPLSDPADEDLAPKLPEGARMTRHPGHIRLLIPGLPKGATRIEFPVRVTHAGRFHTPPANLRPADCPEEEGVSAEGPMLYVE